MSGKIIIGSAVDLPGQEIQKTGGVDFDKPLFFGYTVQCDALLQKCVQDSNAFWENGTGQLRTTSPLAA